MLTLLVFLQVASKSIPNVSTLTGRKKLSDYPNSNSSKQPALFDHAKWNTVLKRHVTVGAGISGDVSGINLVDYAGVTADDDFSQYLVQLEEADVAKLQPAEQLAFWMNAYNALCINLIIQHEKNNNVKIGSINELTTENNPVWDQVAGKVAGDEISLNNIEHDQLRKVWDEPLLHACIVCASASCPNLRPEAFVVSKLKEQMEDQMRLWMKNDSKGIKLTDNSLELSRIFLWFGADFGEWKGIQKFLPQHIEDADLKARVADGNVSVRYFEYDWKINRA
jgi:hypothetical protein